MQRNHSDENTKQTGSNRKSTSTTDIHKTLDIGGKQIKGRIDHPNIPDSLRPSADLIRLSEEQSNRPLIYDEKDDVYYRNNRPE